MKSGIKAVTDNEKKLLAINLHNCLAMFYEVKKLKDEIKQLKIEVAENQRHTSFYYECFSAGRGRYNRMNDHKKRTIKP